MEEEIWPPDRSVSPSCTTVGKNNIIELIPCFCRAERCLVLQSLFDVSTLVSKRNNNLGKGILHASWHARAISDHVRYVMLR